MMTIIKTCLWTYPGKEVMQTRPLGNAHLSLETHSAAQPQPIRRMRISRAKLAKNVPSKAEGIAKLKISIYPGPVGEALRPWRAWREKLSYLDG